MRDAGLTKQERSLLTLIRVLMVLFFVATLLFLFLPNWTLNYITDIGRTFFALPGPDLYDCVNKMWFVLAIAFTATLTLICIIAQNDFLRNLDYMRLIIFSKFVSTTGFIICFISYNHYFLYLAGAIIDGIIFLIGWYYYHAAKTSRSSI